MLKPARMTRLLVGGHQDHLDAVIAAMHQEGLLHLEDFDDPTGGTEIGTPMESGDQVSSYLVRTRGLLRSIGATSDASKTLATSEPGRVLGEAEGEILPIVERETEVSGRLAQLGMEEQALLPFVGIDVDVSLVRTLDTVSGYLGTVEADPSGALAKAGIEFELDSRPWGSGLAMALFVKRQHAATAERILSNVGYVEAQLPEGSSGSPAVRLEEIQSEHQALEADAASIEADLARLREAWGHRLAALEAYLTSEVDKTQAPLRFAVTGKTFHAEGWVPQKQADRFVDSITSEFGDSLYVETLGDGPRGDGHHAEPEDEAPVHLTNNRLAKPFEFLLGLLARPRYKELDPTLLMFIFFPLFFGLMVGDFLIGLVIIVVGLVLKKHKLFGIGGPAVGKSLVLGGIMATLVGGVVFGEALGLHFVIDDAAEEEGEESWETLLGFEFPSQGFVHKEVSEGHHGEGNAGDEHGNTSLAAGDHATRSDGGTIHTQASETESAGGLGTLLAPHGTTHLSVNGWFNLGYYSKIHDIAALLIWSIIIGITHLILGFLLGIRNVYVSHGVKLAIQEKVAWLTLMAGFVVLVWGLMSGAAPLWATPVGGGVIVASLALLWMGAAHVLGAGFVALLEVFGFVGNILSYTRIAAVGASKAGMAVAFSAIGAVLAGGTGTPVWWIVYGFGMVLITALAILAGGLQSLRLQFVEFFSKFYEGGGRPYQPFGRRSS